MKGRPQERKVRPAATAAGSRDEREFHLARSSGGRAHESLELYRLLVEAVQDYAIFALDVTGHILTWNAGARRFKGWTADEAIGCHFSMFYVEEERLAGKPAKLLELAARDGHIEDEGWRVRKDGTRFWADVVITALRDDAGQLVGFAKVTRDLTERREAEEALRDSEERFRLIIQSVKDYAIFMLDVDGNVVSWNDGAHRIKGYTADEIIGRHFSTFYPPEDLEWDKPGMELRAATEEGRFEDEGWRLRSDGSRFWANVIITALFNPNGELIGFAKVTRDLTERRLAEQRALEDARRVAEAQALSRAKSEFLSTLSHELRTPLNAIGGYTDLLLHEVRGPITETQRQDLERIRHSQQHLLLIINDLLNFSRIEAGRVEYDIANVAVVDVIRSVSPMIEPQAHARGVVFAIEEADEALVARADRTKVDQILLNLLSNAVKFTPRGGTVRVRARPAGALIAIEVVDTGVGIEEDRIEEVFEPFVQVGRSLTSAQEGTGLGLAISRDLARAMGGDVTVSSTPGAGSTFTLFLPFSADNP